MSPSFFHCRSYAEASPVASIKVLCIAGRNNSDQNVKGVFLESHAGKWEMTTPEGLLQLHTNERCIAIPTHTFKLITIQKFMFSHLVRR